MKKKLLKEEVKKEAKEEVFFLKAFIELSKENNKFSLYLIYKYFRSKKSYQKFLFMKSLLEKQDTDLYLKASIKAILKSNWKNFVKNNPDLDSYVLFNNPELIKNGLAFSGEINRSKSLKKEAENWWKENKSENF